MDIIKTTIFSNFFIYAENDGNTFKNNYQDILLYNKTSYTIT